MNQIIVEDRKNKRTGVIRLLDCFGTAVDLEIGDVQASEIGYVVPGTACTACRSSQNDPIANYVRLQRTGNLYVHTSIYIH